MRGSATLRIVAGTADLVRLAQRAATMHAIRSTPILSNHLSRRWQTLRHQRLLTASAVTLAIVGSAGAAGRTRWQPNGGGEVTTTTSAEEQPMTSFTGTWKYVHGSGQYAGVKGKGTYKGRFLAKDRYAVKWEGNYSK